MAVERTCVAVIDVLGFGAMVRSADDVEWFSDQYRSVFRSSKVKAKAKGVAITYRLVHDTIVVTSEPSGPIQTITRVMAFCRYVWTSALVAGFPLRGAIAYGPVALADDDVMGIPVDEAAKEEKQQEWVGVMVCASALGVLFTEPDAGDRLLREHAIQTAVPRKTGALRGYALRPDVVGAKTSYDVLENQLSLQRLLCRETRTQRKYDNTLVLLSECRNGSAEEGASE